MNDFLDLQINGCWGVDFNAAELSLEDWQMAGIRLKQAGTSEFLPTIITDSIESMAIQNSSIGWTYAN